MYLERWKQADSGWSSCLLRLDFCLWPMDWETVWYLARTAGVMGAQDTLCCQLCWRQCPRYCLLHGLGQRRHFLEALPREARKEVKSWMCVSETESLIVKMIEDKVVCHGIVVSRAAVIYIFFLFNPQHFDIWNDFEVCISSGFCSYGSEFCEPVLLRHFSWIWYLVRK